VPAADEAVADIEEVPAWAGGLVALHARISQGSPGPSHAGGHWPPWVACSATLFARMVGSWPSPPGEATSDGMQQLLATATWDPDLVREDLGT
jgi:hypothetical protein